MERINWISRSRTLCWIFWKKIIKKSNIQEARQTLKIISVDGQQPYNFFWFLLIFGHLPITLKKKWVDSNQKISCNWVKKIFSRLSQKERFSEPIAKNPDIVNYWWTGVNNYVYSTILVITKIYIFFLIYFTSLCLLIMQSQPALIAWTVTSTAAFYHCWSCTEHFDL